jgi:hypothetical protein
MLMMFNTLGKDTRTEKKDTEALAVAGKEIGLEVNAEKTEYMIIPRDQYAGQNNKITAGNNSFERVEQFIHMGRTLTNQNSIQKEINSTRMSGNACYHSVQNLLSSSLLPKNIRIKIRRTVTLPLVLYGCDTRSLTLKKEHGPRGFQQWVLMKTCGPQREKTTRKLKKTT